MLKTRNVWTGGRCNGKTLAAVERRSGSMIVFDLAAQRASRGRNYPRTAMTPDNAKIKGPGDSLSELTASPVYKENLGFWERAWAPVKTPYTQMPDLPYLSEITEYLQANKAKRVLDLGCGSGWLSIFLSRQDFVVTGLDIAPQALNLAKMWAEQESKSIRFDLGDIADINYPSASFDAVVANSIFEHFTYELADSTMQRLKQLLVPGGLFAGCFDKVGTGPGEFYKLSDGTHVYTDKGRRGMMLRCFENDELRQLFEGWTIDKFEDLPSGSRFVCAHL